jgi:tRNA G46 methylase TrmB
MHGKGITAGILFSVSCIFTSMARGRHPTRIYIDPPSEPVAAKYLLRWFGSDLYRNPQNYPALTSEEIFGNNHSLEIDFGCGTGVLANSRAQRHSDVNVLGIDKSQKPIFCAIAEANGLSLDNVKFIRGDFAVMLQLLRPQTVRAIYYLFPNPPQDYHVDRANGRRRHFLQSIYNALAPGGRFFFATDSNLLFGCMNTILHSDLDYKTREFQLAELDINTRYMQVWEERGRSVNSLMVEKS